MTRDPMRADRSEVEDPTHPGAPLPLARILLVEDDPGADGRAVLDWVINDPRLVHLHVVVLTASAVEEQMLRDFGLPAEHFFRKPVDFTQLIGLIRTVQQLSIHVDRGDPPADALTQR